MEYCASHHSERSYCCALSEVCPCSWATGTCCLKRRRRLLKGRSNMWADEHLVDRKRRMKTSLLPTQIHHHWPNNFNLLNYKGQNEIHGRGTLLEQMPASASRKWLSCLCLVLSHAHGRVYFCMMSTCVLLTYQVWGNQACWPVCEVFWRFENEQCLWSAIQRLYFIRFCSPAFGLSIQATNERVPETGIHTPMEATKNKSQVQHQTNENEFEALFGSFLRQPGLGSLPSSAGLSWLRQYANFSQPFIFGFFFVSIAYCKHSSHSCTVMTIRHVSLCPQGWAREPMRKIVRWCTLGPLVGL